MSSEARFWHAAEVKVSIKSYKRFYFYFHSSDFFPPAILTQISFFFMSKTGANEAHIKIQLREELLKGSLL